jgi:hypothetical protein
MNIEEFGWSAIGFVTTLVARKLTTLALHRPDGEPAMADTARRNRSAALMIAVAAASGVVLALGDVLREHRKQLVDAGV